MERKTALFVSPWTLLAAAFSVTAILLWNVINARLDQDIFFQDRGKITQTPADFELPYEELSLETADGIKLHAWFIPGAGPYGVVIAPGYTDSMSVVLKYAPFLHEAGYQLLLFDPRGQGLSEGELYAFGSFEPKDIEAGMNYLRSIRQVEHIALFGHSNGATATLIAAAQHPYPEVFAVVVDSPFANLKLASQSPEYRDPFLEVFFPLYATVAQVRLGFDLFRKTNALAVVSRVSHVLFIHGTADTKVTFFNSELLYEHAQEPKTLWLVEGVEHVKALDVDINLYGVKVLSLLNQFKP